jgi:hypothetical protein
LGFFKIGVDPDIAQRADRHHTLPGLDIVTGIYISSGNNAVYLGEDGAVTQIEFCLVEIALSLALALLVGGARIETARRDSAFLSLSQPSSLRLERI